MQRRHRNLWLTRNFVKAVACTTGILPIWRLPQVDFLLKWEPCWLEIKMHISRGEKLINLLKFDASQDFHGTLLFLLNSIIARQIGLQRQQWTKRNYRRRPRPCILKHLTATCTVPLLDTYKHCFVIVVHDRRQ